MSDITSTATLDDILRALVAIRDLIERQGRPTPKLIDRPTFAALYQRGESTFDKDRHTGAVGPQPVRIGGRGGALRWHLDEVEAWFRHPDRNGDLLNATDWPAVWAALQARHKNR